MSNGNNFEVALTKCFICGGDSDIIMNTILTEKKASQVKEMHGKVVSHEPCNKCKDYMKKGIIIIAIDADKTDDTSNPYRTGGWWVVKEEYIKRFLEDEKLPKQARETFETAIKKRVLFMEDKICRALGLYDVETTDTAKSDEVEPDIKPEAEAR